MEAGHNGGPALDQDDDLQTIIERLVKEHGFRSLELALDKVAADRARARARAEREDDEPDDGDCAHDWVHTGTAYGGDDTRWHGEGRCYCCKCGADGDA